MKLLSIFLWTIVSITLLVLFGMPIWNMVTQTDASGTGWIYMLVLGPLAVPFLLASLVAFGLVYFVWQIASSSAPSEEAKLQRYKK